MFDDIVKNNRKWYLEIPALEYIEPNPVISEILKEAAMQVERISDCSDCFEINDEKIEFDWGNENTFADARYTMAEWFNYDEDLRFSYQSNIAMFLNDRCNITDHEKRNQLAKELMNIIWG